MYVNPFVLGVLTTIGVEAVAVVLYAVYYAIHKKGE